MKSLWIIRLCILGVLVITPFILSFASNNFYLYQDTNNDQKFDHRIHFKGDLMRELSKYETKSTVEWCSLYVHMTIVEIDCGNYPPCPNYYSCGWTGSTALIFIFNTEPCSCFTPQAEQGEQGYIYMATEQQNLYMRIPTTASEFNNFLLNNFQMVEHQGEEQRCDSSFSVSYILGCDSTWYCSHHSCHENPNAHVTQIIVSEPLCMCYYVGPAVPSFSQWGIIFLMVFLIAISIFILIRKQKASIVQ